MSILGYSSNSKASPLARITNPFTKSTGKRPENYMQDYPEGFIITEYINGKEGVGDSRKATLRGNMKPKQPFQYGGSQRLVKDYYPGNSEPVVHVLGPEESNVTIRGRLYCKRFKDDSMIGLENFKKVAYEMAKQLDAMRLRGNMVRLDLGTWKRFAFIEATDFKLKNNSDIDYEIRFSIVGFNKPRNYQKVSDKADIPTAISHALLKDTLSYQEKHTIPNIPGEIPVSIADIINDATNELAGAISTVTDYMEAVVSTVEDISQAINKAIGVIRYAQIACVKYKDRLGRISLNNDLGPYITGGVDEKKPKEYTSSSYIFNAQGGANDLASMLASMRVQFAAYRETAPLARYRTVEGDSLQKIAVKFYNDSSQWEEIYEHNELESTELEVGLFLEIPQI